MKYRNKTIRFEKMIATHNGFLKNMCDTCKTIDCEHPIEKRKVSELGIMKESRFYVRGDDIYIVISCDGYME